MIEKWGFFTTKEIKPLGWLRRQLSIQAHGLSGNLDKIWPDIKDSAWIGGGREGWERVPYWLDGFVPLAYLLDDDDMKARAQKYIEAIIAGQKEDGWLCPCEDSARATYDTWAVQLICKTLTVYYDCTGDERIPDILYRTLKNYYDLLAAGTIRLHSWGKARWFEAFIAMNRIYEIYGEEWIRDLARILKEQGADYEGMVNLWMEPKRQWTWETHIVNLSMMLKYEAVSHKLLGAEYTGIADKLYEILYQYNGTPVELFTGDECLAGIGPIHGTELCAVAELMYSYELLYAHTGDKKWAEKLEVLAFNALPATISDDMWTHQYDQMSNQIACIEFPDSNHVVFGTNRAQAHLFGLEPEYGCCTANFNQAWPKFTLSAFMHNGNTILNTVPVPAHLCTDKTDITLETDYPFENRFTYTVNRADEPITLMVRVPSFAMKIKVNGELTEYKDYLTFPISAGDTTIITVEYETAPFIFDRPNNLKSVKCGSLVFALPIKYELKMREYEENGVKRIFPYCDYELIGKSDWNYAFSSEEFKLVHNNIAPVPFSSEHPAVVLEADMVKIDWGMHEVYANVCAMVPNSTEKLAEPEKMELYPYGCAKLRMTEMPLVSD